MTTYRKLSESAVDKIATFLGNDYGPWTGDRPIPGGVFKLEQLEEKIIALLTSFSFLEPQWGRRLFRSYGMDTFLLLRGANTIDDLGINFGFTITQREIDSTIEKEWAKCAEDFLWRRSKLGLVVTPDTVKDLDEYISHQL